MKLVTGDPTTVARAWTIRRPSGDCPKILGSIQSFDVFCGLPMSAYNVVVVKYSAFQVSLFWKCEPCLPIRVKPFKLFLNLLSGPIDVQFRSAIGRMKLPLDIDSIISWNTIVST
jgi:hypothetical protein